MNSTPFTVNARVSPQSVGSGYFILSDVGENKRLRIPFEPGEVTLGNATPDNSGQFSFMSELNLKDFGEITVRHPGSVSRWPANVSVPAKKYMVGETIIDIRSSAQVLIIVRPGNYVSLSAEREKV